MVGVVGLSPEQYWRMTYPEVVACLHHLNQYNGGGEKGEARHQEPAKPGQKKIVFSVSAEENEALGEQYGRVRQSIAIKR